MVRRDAVRSGTSIDLGSAAGSFDGNGTAWPGFRRGFGSADLLHHMGWTKGFEPSTSRTTTWHVGPRVRCARAYVLVSGLRSARVAELDRA